MHRPKEEAEVASAMADQRQRANCIIDKQSDESDGHCDPCFSLTGCPVHLTGIDTAIHSFVRLQV